MKKRLYRSRRKILGGVLGGFAEHFDHDPLLWRLGFIVLLLVTGLMPFTAVYLIAWVIIPDAPEIKPFNTTTSTEKEGHE